MLKIQDEIRRGKTMYRVVFTHPETGKRTNRRWPARADAEAFLAAVDGFGLAQAITFDDTKRTTPAVVATGSSLPFGEYATKYLERRRRLSTGSQDTYAQRVAMIAATPLGTVPIRDITPDHVEAFVTVLDTWVSPRTGRPLKSSSKRNRLVFVRSVLTDAHRRGDIPTNPGAFVEPIAEDDDDALPPTILEPREFAAIAAHLAPEHVPFFRFALESGCRYGELIALRWENLEPDPEDPEIVLVEIVKGKTTAAERTTTVPRSLVAEIPLTDADVVFPSAAEHTWRRRWTTAVGRAQSAVHSPDPITVSPRIHDLRHTHAVLMLTEADMNLTALAARLGHSSPAITAKYYARFGKRQIATLGRMAAAATAGFRTLEHVSAR